MFTGLIRALGQLQQLQPQGDGLRLQLDPQLQQPWQLGSSLAVNGICLTIVEITAGVLSFELSAETLARSTAGSWAVGQQVNVEPSLRLGDELGGHWVSGHIDGVCVVSKLRQSIGEIGTEFSFSCEPQLLEFIATKGSVAVDGVSLTVNHTGAGEFSVTVIPWTAAKTTLGTLKLGESANLEVDILARYARNKIPYNN